MNKSVVSGIIGCCAGIAIVAMVIWAYDPPESLSPGEGENEASQGRRNEPVPPLPPVVRPTVENPEEAIARLPEESESRTNKGRFIVSGQGEDADWGIGKMGNFQYTVDVVADSEILSKKALYGGKVKVIEKRTFREVRDSMIVSDVDVKFRLDTLPVKTISKAIDVASALWTTLTGDSTAGLVAKVTKDLAERQLQKVDGKGLRDLLGFTGLQAGPEVEKALNKLAGRSLTKALGNIRRVSGKSYLVTYYQSADSQPLYVTFKNEDGTDITDEEEQLVLKRVNAFLDYCLIPDKASRPGDSWRVHAEEFQELFDPFVDGDYVGMLTLKRDSNNENGDWVVSVVPGEVKISSPGRGTTGSLQIESGRAEVDPKKISLKSMYVSGNANLKKLTKHHWLFTARLSGDCEFEGRLIIGDGE